MNLTLLQVEKAKIVGVWIDAREAMIIDFSDPNDEIKTIRSEVEPNHRSTGGLHMSGGNIHSQHGQDYDRRLEHRREHEFNRFFDEVADQLKDTVRLRVYGPGIVKTHFVDRLKKNSSLSSVVEAVETAHRVSETELTQMVKEGMFGK